MDKETLMKEKEEKKKVMQIYEGRLYMALKGFNVLILCVFDVYFVSYKYIHGLLK